MRHSHLLIHSYSALTMSFLSYFFFFFNDTATTEIYTLSLHDALPIYISGPFAALGAEARDGFNLAIKQLGSKLGGQPAEFLQTDMGGNPDQARQLVTRYIQRDKVDFFTGPIGSNVALAVGPALFGAKVPY